MKKYRIHLKEILLSTSTVEANDEDEARQKVKDGEDEFEEVEDESNVEIIKVEEITTEESPDFVDNPMKEEEDK